MHEHWALRMSNWAYSTWAVELLLEWLMLSRDEGWMVWGYCDGKDMVAGNPYERQWFQEGDPHTSQEWSDHQMVFYTEGQTVRQVYKSLLHIHCKLAHGVLVPNVWMFPRVVVREQAKTKTVFHLLECVPHIIIIIPDKPFPSSASEEGVNWCRLSNLFPIRSLAGSPSYRDPVVFGRRLNNPAKIRAGPILQRSVCVHNIPYQAAL